jgi:hypothetical protein
MGFRGSRVQIPPSRFKRAASCRSFCNQSAGMLSPPLALQARGFPIQIPPSRFTHKKMGERSPFLCVVRPPACCRRRSPFRLAACRSKSRRVGESVDHPHRERSNVALGSGKPRRGTNLLVNVNGDHVQPPIGRGQWVWGEGQQGDVHGQSPVVDGQSPVVDGHSAVAPDIRPLSTDKPLMSTDKRPMSTDRRVESVAASPLSTDKCAGFTGPPCPGALTRIAGLTGGGQLQA